MTIEESNSSSGRIPEAKVDDKKQVKASSKASKENKNKSSYDQQEDRREVLLKAGPLEYKIPGKRQRIILGSVVVGLNVILLLAVALYFYSPAFKDFIYNIGR